VCYMKRLHCISCAADTVLLCRLHSNQESDSELFQAIKNAPQLAKVEVDSVAKKQTLPDKAIAHLVWDLVR
jgi:hypothetical protein